MPKTALLSVKKQNAFAKNLLNFINEAVSPYHAVEAMSKHFLSNGFTQLNESDLWSLKLGGKYFVKRKNSSIAGFIVGQKVVENGFNILGAHTDSPCLKLKPNPLKVKKGLNTISAEVYGSPILATWTDRDLGLAGLVMLKEKGDKIINKLVHFDKPLLKIPNLAIHLNREVNSKGLKINPQTQGNALISIADKPENFDLKALLANKLKVKSDSIMGYDLNMVDTQKASFLGVDNQFISSARLDNLVCCYCSMISLLELSNTKLKSNQASPMMVCFDHEEIGSLTSAGARSNFLEQLIKRIIATGNNHLSGNFPRTLANSKMVSADMAHGIHPNFIEASEENHYPNLGRGVVIKMNAKGAYATSESLSAWFKNKVESKGLKTQYFLSRADFGCGSTIGPFVSTLGLDTLDLGIAMLSMHSIREICAKSDPYQLKLVFDAIYG